MKIYVILIALLPLVAIGLDIYRDESKLAFMRDVAAPLSGENAAVEADDTELPAAAKIAPHGETAGGEDPPAARPIDSGALTDIATDAGGTAEFETPGIETPGVEIPVVETPLAETLGIETEGSTAREAAKPPGEPATGETSAAAAATPVEPAREAARATASPSAAESVSSEPASAAAAGRIDPNLVWLVQDRLNRLGYAGSDPLIPDGRLNLDTKLAVRAYQIHRGMPSDGLPSATLLEHLESSLEDSLVNNAPSLVEMDTTASDASTAAAGGTAESAPQATESVVQVSEPRATQEAALPAGGDATVGMVFQEAEPEAPNASLVFLIQDRLNRLGHSGDRRLSVDGRMGPRTRATIVAYQEDRGLPPTGAPTEALLGHMEAALIGKTPPAASPTPATAAAPEPPSETAESHGLASTAANDGEDRAAANTEVRPDDEEPAASERPLAATGPAIESGSSGTEDEAAPPTKVSGYESFRRGLEATRQGSTETAIAHYSRAIDSEDWLEKHLAFSRRGDAHYALGNLDAALADYSAAIRLKPDDTGAMLRRALIYETKAMLDRAISDYRRVTELDPDEPRAAERLERLGITVE